MPEPRTRALEVENLSVEFGDFTAVDDISFSVDAGEIFGFLGANGAGKTTTIRVLCGLITPSQGKVVVSGEPIDDDDGMSLKRKVGYMSQKFTLWDDLTVAENLRFAADLHKMEASRLRQRQEKLLEMISYKRSLQTFVRDLPGGLKQQVSLATALLHDPDIVFLDEPTAGVTPAARARFWRLIRQVAAEGKTVFVTTHYMDEAEQCDRIALMRAGQIIALDGPVQLKRDAFPHGLLELEPKTSLSREALAQLKSQFAFNVLQPYGLRYHAELSDRSLEPDLKKDWADVFLIRQISPSLEDVFIRLVEGANR